MATVSSSSTSSKARRAPRPVSGRSRTPSAKALQGIALRDSKRRKSSGSISEGDQHGGGEEEDADQAVERATQLSKVADVDTPMTGTGSGRARRANRVDTSDRWQAILDSAKENFVNNDDDDQDSVATPATNDEDEDDDDEARVNNTSTAAADDSADAIRCVCGQTEEVEDDDKTFIQCDKCQVWQHAPCVGLSDDAIPEQYFCEQCRPDLHKKLLRRLLGGKSVKSRKPAQQSIRKRKRTSLGPVASTSAEAVADDDDDAYVDMKDAAVSDDDHGDSDVSAGNEETDPEDEIQVVPRPRKRSLSGTASKSPRRKSTTMAGKKPPIKGKKSNAVDQSTTASSNLDEMQDPLRRSVAKALINDLQKAAELVVSEEPPAEFPTKPDAQLSLAQSTAFAVEFAMYRALIEPSATSSVGQKYKDKYRQLSFNLKDPKNPSLRKRVLAGSIQPTTLVLMTSEDMANPEAKALAEQVREEAMRQSVLEVDNGPRIRRTHKGEEIIEGPDDNVAAASSSAVLPQAARSADEDSPLRNTPQVEQDVGIARSPAASEASNDSTATGSAFDTPPPQKQPVLTRPRDPVMATTSAATSSNPPRSPNYDNDAANLDSDEDVHAILAADTNETAGYVDEQRPKVWSGKVIMTGVSEFEANATLAGGPKDDPLDASWRDILPSLMQIDGRIAKPDATKYLLHQRHSSSKAVMCLIIEPRTSENRAIDRLSNYFVSKSRFGVLKPGSPHPSGFRIRDGYLVPLASDEPLPEFVETLPKHTISTRRTANLLLAMLVVERPITGRAASTSSVALPEASLKSPTAPLPALQTSGPALLRKSSSAADSNNMPSTPSVGAPTPTGFAPAQRNYFDNKQGGREAQGNRQTAPAAASATATPAPQPVAATAPNLTESDTNMLLTFLQARPEIAADPAVASDPARLSRLLLDFAAGKL
ncbi:Transcription factor bye1 [Savitreella phatthalungensis]